MVKRNANAPDQEPEQSSFDLPSEKEHLFQVSDVFTNQDEMGIKIGLDENTVSVKCEVVGGDEEGRTLLCRLSLDDTWKGFFATRLFLKAIGEPYKGNGFDIDTDRWQGCQFYASVSHVDSKGKTYANITEYNFDKIIENDKSHTGKAINQSVQVPQEEIAWDEPQDK